MRSEKREIVGTGVGRVGGGDRCVAVFPVGKIPLLGVIDFFTGIKAVPLAIVGEHEYVRVVDNFYVIMARQEVIKKIVRLALASQRIGKVHQENGSIWNFQETFLSGTDRAFTSS